MTSTSESDLLAQVKLAVEEELRNYKYSVHESAIGTPWSEHQVRAELEKMREALVDPYWADVIIPGESDNLRQEPTRSCIAVADNREGYLVLYDPEEKCFMLAHTTNGPLMTWGLKGDAVDCFFSI